MHFVLLIVKYCVFRRMKIYAYLCIFHQESLIDHFIENNERYLNFCTQNSSLSCVSSCKQSHKAVIYKAYIVLPKIQSICRPNIAFFSSALSLDFFNVIIFALKRSLMGEHRSISFILWPSQNIWTLFTVKKVQK